MPHKDNLAAHNEWLADEGEPLDLDAIRFSAPFAIDSVRLVLHPSPFVRFVPPDYAARCGSENPVVPSEMACGATNDRAFKAALCGCGRSHLGQSKKCRTSDKRFHSSLRLYPWRQLFLTLIVPDLLLNDCAADIRLEPCRGIRGWLPMQPSSPSKDMSNQKSYPNQLVAEFHTTTSPLLLAPVTLLGNG